MPVRRRRVAGPAQSVGAPKLREPRAGRFGPRPGGLAQRVPWRTQPKQHRKGPGLVGSLGMNQPVPWNDLVSYLRGLR